MQQLKPITFHFSTHKIFQVSSLIDRITDTDTPFVHARKTNETFRELASTIYLPLLTFINTQQIEANIIITGEFLNKLAKYSPKAMSVLLHMLKERQVTLVLDAYHGNSLSSLYNMRWWARSVEKTNNTVIELTGGTAEYIYLPQLFRSLELERVVQSLGISKFVLKNKNAKSDLYQSTLSEFRRFDGDNARWLEGELDIQCKFYFVPSKHFFVPNNIIFERELITAVRAFCMNAGLKYNNFILRSSVAEKTVTTMRIAEKFSLGMYTHMQRSVIRMWDYASLIIASEEHIEDQEYTRLKTISSNFASLQDPFYLMYLQPKLYTSTHSAITNFSSPYEAYASMQACVKHLEILLKNKI
jgi:Glycosyl hydrolase family 57